MAAVEIDAAHAGASGEGNEVSGVDFAFADLEFLLGEDDDGAAFGGFVGEGSELGGVGKLKFGDTGRGEKGGRLTVTECDGAGLVEEKDIDIAGGFNGASGHGEDVGLQHAVHAGDADGGEERADGCGD